MKGKRFDPVEFRIKFRAFFATLAFLCTMALIFCAVFLKSTNSELLKYVLSFLMGSLLTAVITFYFDGNENQNDKNTPDIPTPEIPPNSLIKPDEEKDEATQP